MDFRYDEIRALIDERLAASAAERLAGEARRTRSTAGADVVSGDGSGADRAEARDDSFRGATPEAEGRLQPLTMALRPAAAHLPAGAASPCC